MSYKKDPNNSNKMVPNTPNFTETYNYATTPAEQTIVDKPNYIVVNNAGTYMFAYQSGSVSTYTTGSILDGDSGPVKLDIQPVAWDGLDSKTGDVTFVYTGVK
tara:strand:- start:530 stop:838 length:309 start_codon:yes stop_codon:yes gene_type:complete